MSERETFKTATIARLTSKTGKRWVVGAGSGVGIGTDKMGLWLGGDGNDKTLPVTRLPRGWGDRLSL